MTIASPNILADRAAFPGPASPSALTVVILTKNEAARLPRCIAAIPARYPVLVLDSGSTDETQSLARQLGCAVIEHAWQGATAQRNFALQHCGIASGWVLFVDADEVFQAAFFDRFETALAADESMDAYFVTSLLCFRGRVLRHAPGYPILHARLLRMGSLRFVSDHPMVGETVPAGTRTGIVDLPYLHEFYEGDVEAWLRKHIGYAAGVGGAPAGAYATPRRRLEAAAGRSVLRPFLRFFYHYILRGGFRDGREGFEYALMYAWYELTRYVIARCNRRP